MLGSFSKIKSIQREYNEMNEALMDRAIERKDLLAKAISERLVLSRWGWFWHRLCFWKYRVVRVMVVDDWPKIRCIKYMVRRKS